MNPRQFWVFAAVLPLWLLAGCSGSDSRSREFVPCPYFSNVSRGSPACVDACFAQAGLSLHVVNVTFDCTEVCFTQEELTPVALASAEPALVRVLDPITLRGSGLGQPVTEVASVRHDVLWSTTTTTLLDTDKLEAEVRPGFPRTTLTPSHGAAQSPVTETFQPQQMEWRFRGFSLLSLLKPFATLAAIPISDVLETLLAAPNYQRAINALAYESWFDNDRRMAPVTTPAGAIVWARTRRQAACGSDIEIATWSNPVTFVWARPATSAAAFQARCEEFPVLMLGDHPMTFCEFLSFADTFL